MSSPTEVPDRNYSRAAVAARQANNWSLVFRVLGVGAALGGVGLAGYFALKVGVLAPPPPQDVKSDVQIPVTDRIAGGPSHITGVDRNKRPFEINAASGVQDKTIETTVHLEKVNGKFERPTGDKLVVDGDSGQYDTNSKIFDIAGNVVISEADRMTARMEKARVNSDDQSVESLAPVHVDMKGTMIEAAHMKVTEEGNRVLFSGGVKARLQVSDATGTETQTP